MAILALETSMGACSAAVLTDASSPVLYAREEAMAQGHAEALLPMVEAVMREAGLGFDAIQLIAATVGPGSFTGVRIAISAARAFQLATGAKLWGSDSLSVMAGAAFMQSAVRRNGEAPFAVAVDARRGMLYFGLYDTAGRTLQGPVLVGVEEAVALMPNDLRIAVGNGAALLAAAAQMAGRSIEPLLPELQPNAATLAEMALEAGISLPSLRPLYLRAPDAKPQNLSLARR